MYGSRKAILLLGMAAPHQIARLTAMVDAGLQTHIRGQTVWIGYPGIKIRAGNGELTPAGMHYEHLMTLAGRHAQTRLFHSDADPTMVHAARAVERATDRAGRTSLLRRWDPSMNKRHGAWNFTHAGQRFHGRVRFDIEVPVWVHKVNHGRPDVAYDHWDGRPATLPMTDDYLIHDHALGGDFGIVRDVNTLQAQAHFIEEALKRHFEEAMQDPEKIDHDSGRLLFSRFVQSDVYYTYRPDGQFKINYQGVELHDHAPPTVETVLGRALHGVFDMSPTMLWALELEETARKDLSLIHI